jgi:transcriptional regulator with XRE-family HTH domain
MEKVEFNKLFGEFVRMKRKQLNLSQQQLAYKMGLDYQYISRVERGLISPTLFWIVGLSKVLETTLDQFVSELYVFIQR